jgi:hypothetical protein
MSKHARSFRRLIKKCGQGPKRASKKYFDKRGKVQFFKEGQEVLLSAKNIRVRKPCKKLTERFLGPFKVVKRAL